MLPLLIAVTVTGCQPSGPGTIGIDSFTADVGDTVTVPVRVHTNAEIEAYLADILFPESIAICSSVSDPPPDCGPEHGPLTEGWFFIGASDFSESGLYGGRFGGFGGPPVPPDTEGILCTLGFVVVGEGDGEFSFWNKLDHLEGYGDGCAAPPNPTSVRHMSTSDWGRVKGAYR